MDDDVKELLGRTKPGQQAKNIEPPREGRYVYGGEPLRNPAVQGARPNRKIVRRRVSTFNTIALLFGGGIAIVMYVNHIITIDRLAAEVGQLQVRYEQIQNVNAGLRSEVNRKAAWEKIGATATNELGLTFPQEQPTMITVDPDVLERARGQ